MAGAVGLVHAAFSIFWALGGRWLLDTVGPAAVRLAERSPGLSAVALGLVAAVKVAGAVVPLLVESGRLSGRRVWRGLEWAGGAVLVAYGGVNTAVALAVLSGVVSPEGGYDRAAMIGHGVLWDPLFLAWGVLLLIGLARSRS